MLGFKFDSFFAFFFCEFCAQGCFRLCSAVRHGFGSSVGSSCGACWDAGLDLLSSVHTGRSASSDTSLRLRALVSHLVKMSLRHPSERTQTLVACMVTGCGGDFMADDVGRQTTLLSACKSVLKSKITHARVQGVVIPGPYLEQLLNEFDALPVEIRQQVFAGTAPNPPVELNPFWQAAATWPCRITHTGVRLVRMQSHLSLPGVSQAMMTQHVAVQAARALVGQVPAAFKAGLPGFQLLPAGVEVAAAAAPATRAETTQSGQLQSLMDRAREPAGSQATAGNQLALPAPQAETLPGNVGPSEVVYNLWLRLKPLH